MSVIMLWPRVRVCDDEMQLDVEAGKSSDATECRATLEEVGGSQERRGVEKESDEQVSAWPKVTDSDALPRK